MGKPNRRWAMTLGGLLLAGCLGGPLDAERLAKLAESNPLPKGATPVAKVPPASVEAAARVDAIGRQILAANPETPGRPIFITVGRPADRDGQPTSTAGVPREIFHGPGGDIYITESLVERCTTDGQLAAVLCSELGRMAAEREAVSRVSGTGRRDDQGPPPVVPIGSDGGSDAITADRVRLAELARYEQKRKQQYNKAIVGADPKALARAYLTRSGYAEAELEAVAPLLREAATSNTLERQMTRSPINGR